MQTHCQGCHRLAPTAGASQCRGEVSSTSNQTSRRRKNEKDGCGQNGIRAYPVCLGYVFMM